MKTEKYSASKERWAKAEASLAGITAGHVQTHEPDILHSFKFLQKLLEKYKLNLNYVIDCGAGIGRISEHVLTHFFAQIDILERDEKFVEYCKKIFANNAKVKNFFCSPLETFKFTQKYDAIWVQLVLQYLEEDDIILFLSNCQKALNKNGLIIVKENFSETGFFIHEEGFIRCAENFANIFAKSGLEIVYEDFVQNMPEGFITIKSYALRTKRKKFLGIF